MQSCFSFAEGNKKFPVFDKSLLTISVHNLLEFPLGRRVNSVIFVIPGVRAWTLYISLPEEGRAVSSTNLNSKHKDYCR